MHLFKTTGFPGGAVVKNPPANAGDEREMGSISGSGRFPGGGNGNLLQYSCLENSMDRGTGWGRKESDMTEQLSTEHRDSMQYYLATWTILKNTVMKQKLESRLPGEISISSDRQMASPLWQKAKRN